MQRTIEQDLAFALRSATRGALTYEEFHLWVEKVIENSSSLPTYFFDLYDAKNIFQAEDAVRDSLRKNLSIGLTLKEGEALWGIAMKRGRNPEDFKGLITEKTALKRLEEYPHVVERFKKTFPFIQLDI